MARHRLGGMGSSFEGLRMSGLGAEIGCIRIVSRTPQEELEWEGLGAIGKVIRRSDGIRALQRIANHRLVVPTRPGGFKEVFLRDTVRLPPKGHNPLWTLPGQVFCTGR